MKKKNGFILNITHRSTQKGIVVLKKAGYNKPSNANEMYNMLEDYLKNKPNEAFPELCKIHPDAKLIIKAYDEWKLSKAGLDKEQKLGKELEKLEDKFANCSGCPGSKQEVFSATGDEKPKLSATTIIVAGTSVIAIALIAAIVISKSK